MSSDLISIIKSHADKWDIPFSAEQAHALEVFYEEIVRFSPLLGLTHASEQELPAKHFLDSLLPLPILKKMEFSDILDIGSGGGFPALPLAVMMPDCQFTLCERNTRKAGFLLSAAALMGLKNVHIFPGDFIQVREGFQLCTFRALMKLTAKQARNVLKKARRGLAYKGRLDETKKEARLLMDAGFSVHIDTLPPNEFIIGQRTLLWFACDEKFRERMI